MNTLTLPWPPSLNGLFIDGRKRRSISKRYEQWLAEAASALSEQRWAAVSGSVRVRLILAPPDNRERDADNYLKAPLDFLVKSGVLKGDSRSFVAGVSSDWSDSPPGKPGAITVAILPADDRLADLTKSELVALRDQIENVLANRFAEAA